MSLFSKTEVSKEILPFIENGEGVGVVKVNGYGKASARMESYKIIFDSYEGKSPIIESVSAITYLSYKKGNFLNEPKLEIGISHKKYVLAGVDNNDAELETFYKTILDIKNLEKEQKRSSYMGINKSNIENEAKTTEPVSNQVIEEDDLDLEQDITKEDIGEEEVVETDAKNNAQDSTEDLEKILQEDEDDFEVLEESDEEVEITEESKVEDKEVPVEEEVQVTENESQVEEAEITDDEKEIENSDEIISDDFDDDDEFEEIFIESDEPPADDFNEDNLLSDEPIIEDFDDDFEELEDFDDELSDKDMNSGRIIKEPEETTQEEVVIEEDISDEIEEEPEPVEEEPEPVEEKADPVEEEQETVKEVSEQVVTSQAKENIIEENNPQTNVQIDDDEITTENVSSEIGKLKQHLYGGINSIQNEFNKGNQNSQNNMENVQFDPVDQIRRYHELKEEGIITEEEFELKKKQLLGI